MGTIYHPNDSIHVTKHKLHVGSKSLLLTIHESDSIVILYIGGHDKYCIEALVYKQVAEEDVSQGHLSHVYYNVNCSLENNFQRGVDTDMIVKLLMAYIKDTYPYVSSLRFEDTSYRTCDNNQIVELAEMNYVYSGKTWYEMKFGAYLDGKDALVFTEANRIFQAKKESMNWNSFKKYITIPLPYDDSILETMYTTSLTWQDFFSSLRNKMGVADFCTFLSPWFHRFMNIIFKLNLSRLKYILPLTKSVSYTMTPYVRGGKRHTRKILKQRPRNES